MSPRRIAVALPVLLAGACMVGPNYHRPPAPVPEAFKEMPKEGTSTAVSWKTAQPGEAAQRTKWWETFGDPDLNALEERVNVSNQTIAQAEAQYRAARALVAGVRSSLFPSLGVSPSAARSSGIVTSAKPASGQAAPAVTTYEVPVEAGWELDLFGQVRRSLQAQVASAVASAADLESVRLAMRAEAAADYFLLRGTDAEIQLLQKTVAGYQAELNLTENRFRQGVASGIDVAQARTQLESTRVQATDLQITRAQLEHSLAVLAGQPPAGFSMSAAPIGVAPPVIPVAVPSELLERRPDVAAAERRMAAANAQIGVAVAAYYPSVSLSGLVGYEGSAIAGLFSLPNRIWSLGASLAETIFDAGKRHAAYRQAQASYDGTVAAYRQTVLAALQDVEDNLVALRVLAEEVHYQTVAVVEAERALSTLLA